MKIKILNKNLNHPNANLIDYSDVKEYEVDEGAVFTECYNETLDTGTIIISNLEEKLEIEPYDIVAIYRVGTTLWKYMCVDTYTETMLSVNPKIYKYEISLFSETKQLEGTILPNLKITSLMDGTSRSVYDYINQYMDEYCPKIRAKGWNEFNPISPFSVNSQTLEYSNNIAKLVVDITSASGLFYSTNIQVRASVLVRKTVISSFTTVTDNDCEIVSNTRDGASWNIVFKVNLGTYASRPFSASLSNYKIYRWSETGVNKFKLSNKLYTKFSMSCPEMQWNTPTLREVLNDLMMVADCIPVLKNSVLDYLDLTEIKSDVSNDTHINYVTKSKSSEDYVSELQVKLENVTNSIKNVDNFATKVEYYNFDIATDEVLITTNNILVRTKYPIYNLKSLRIMFPAYYETTVAVVGGDEKNRKWIERELMFIKSSDGLCLVSEYQEWTTKKVTFSNILPDDLYLFPKYQNSSLYYTRGSNEIKGFSQSGKFLLWNIYLLNDLLTAILKDEQFAIPNTVEVPGYLTVLFRVEYETLEGCLFRASKNELPDNERVIIDNQTNSYVDSYNQGFLEYQKANRLGNEQLQINARYSISDVFMKIGDKFEDSVIYQCQYQYFKDHVEVNAIATKDYVLRDYFTGVKSKIRSWKIADGSEALLRYDLIKYYCEFSYINHTELYGLNSLSQNDVALYLVSPFSEYNTPSPLNYVFINAKDKNNNIYPTTYSYQGIQENIYINRYYILDLVTRIVGNSLVFSIRLDDNYWVGKSIKMVDDRENNNDEVYVHLNEIKVGLNGNMTVTVPAQAGIWSVGGYPTVERRYTDNNGENIGGTIIFTDKMKMIPTMKKIVVNPSDPLNPYYADNYIEDIRPGKIWYSTNLDNVSNETKDFLNYIYQRPIVYENAFKYEGVDSQYSYNYEQISVDFNFKKDSQEITGISTQFEFCTDTNNICFSKEWLSRQKAINALSNNVSNYKGLFYNSSEYNFRRPNDLPTNGYVEEDSITIHPYSSNNINVGIYVIYKSAGLATSSQTVAENEAKTLKTGKTLYICDTSNSSTKVLFALNDIPDGNCFGYQLDGQWYPAYLIHMNVLKSRNKNIYDNENHYLIVDKI